MKRIYLDNHATTPVDPSVMEKMEPWFTKKFGNASSQTHSFGWEAREACDISREQIARAIKSNSSEIIFTSGATESINISIRGVVYNIFDFIPHIITLNTEHRVVLDTCSDLENIKAEITYLNVKSNGIIDIEDIKKAIKKNTVLISILHGNNEIGVLQPIKKIGKICKNKNIIFHVDGAQTLGKTALDMNEMNIDLFSMSGHKIYGPKGIGALFIKRQNPKINLKPIITGGGQEGGIRSGTLPVPLVVGFGEAVEIAYKNLNQENKRIQNLRNLLLDGLKSEISEINVNGDLNNRLSGNLNVNFPNINGEELIMKLREICISNGSACTSSNIKPSHVLKALGLSDDLAFSSIRFGIGRFNTENDIKRTIKLIALKIKNLKNQRVY